MARMDVIKKSRKEHKCSNCTRPIPVGSSYRRWRINFSPDYVLCNDCPTPTRSRFTTSEIKAACWDIQDDEIEAFETPDEFEDVVQGLADRIQEEVLDIVQEKMDNIEDGIGHTDVPVYEELQDRLYELEAWRDEVDSISPEDYVEEGACSECGLSEDDCVYSGEDHDFSPEDEFDHEAAMEALQDALSSCPE